MADVPQDCGRCGAPAPAMQPGDSVRCEFCGAIMTRPNPKPEPEPDPVVVVVEEVAPKRRREPRRRWQPPTRRRRRSRRERDHDDELDYDWDEPRRPRGTVIWPFLIPIAVLLVFFFGPCLMCGGVFSLPFFGAEPAKKNVHVQINDAREQHNVRMTEARLKSATHMLRTQVMTRRRLPDKSESDRVIGRMRDAWNRPLRYEPKSETVFVIRSAGPDSKLSTDDDLTEEFDASEIVDQ